MKKRILLVEYCSSTIEVIKQALPSKIFDISVAGSEEVAKKLLKHRAYDMVITETLLPKSHGFLLSKFVHENYPQTKIIIISEKLKAVDYRQSSITEYGAVDFFEKPLDTKKLEHTVFNTLKITPDEIMEMEDSADMTTNVHILPNLEELAAKKKMPTKTDSFGKILEDVQQDSTFEIDLD